MIYQPSFPSPHLNTIDATKENVFRFCVNGNYVDKYQITIYDVATNEVVYQTDEVQLGYRVYGNNGDDSFIDVNIPADSGMRNGYDYKWVVKMWQSGIHDIPVVYGRVYSPNTTATEIFVAPHKQDSVHKGMKLQIGNNQYPINSYYPQYPICTVTESSTWKYSNYRSYSYICLTDEELAFFNVGDEVLIYNTSLNRGGYIQRTITAKGYDSNAGKNGANALVLSYNNGQPVDTHGFDTYAKDDFYGPTTIEHIHNQSVYGIISTNGLPSRIKAGTQYSIMYDAVENDLEFFFQARDNGNLNVYVNDTSVSDICNIQSSVIKITADYEQAQGVAIKYWKVDIEFGGNAIASSGQVFNGCVNYTYDALLSKNTYIVTLMVVNDADVVIERKFKVRPTYVDAVVFAKPEIKAGCDPYVELSWENTHTIYGDGDFENTDDVFKDGMLVLQKNQSVTWDTIDNEFPLEFPDTEDNPSYIEVLSTNFTNFDGKIVDVFSLSGDLIEVGYDGRTFWWARNGSERKTYDPYSGVFDGLFPGALEITDISDDELCCYWSADENVSWSNSDIQYWYSYDVGQKFWWLIRINLSEKDDDKLVTFTRYRKE